MSEHEEKSTADSEERSARDLVGRVAFAALIEQRRARRWSIFFRFLFFAYLFALLLVFWPNRWEAKPVMGKRHTALINVEGVISSSTDASAKNVIAGLRAAFKNGDTAGIILHVNSPGGSAVQAGEIYDEILRLRQEHPQIPIYAVATDVCASGGYYIAAAAQQIYANRASIVGSIGVRADSFGFVDAMDKLGIERRLYTSGENKAFLDPFSPPQPDDVRHLRTMLDDIHRQFVSAVREGRGERLKDAPELFSGLIWTGEQSVALGLIDGLASPRYVAKEIIGAETMVDFTRRQSVFEQLFNGVEAVLARVSGRVPDLHGQERWPLLLLR